MTLRTTLLAVALLGSTLAVQATARADGVEKSAVVCGACHGMNGVPVNKSIPVIWGQNDGYLYLQLRDYKSGARQNITMSAIAAGLDKPAMKELAAYFAAKPWPNLQQPRAASDVAHHAQTINELAGCQGCHLDAWQGDTVTPRLAGQTLPYLREVMAKFRNGERANNPWMVALLKTYSDDDIDALAKYIAGY